MTGYVVRTSGPKPERTANTAPCAGCGALMPVYKMPDGRHMVRCHGRCAGFAPIAETDNTPPIVRPW